MTKSTKRRQSDKEARGGATKAHGKATPPEDDTTAQRGSSALSGDPANTRRGRPPKFPDEVRREARRAYLAGDTAKEIAARIGASDRTVSGWIRKGGWRAELDRRRQSASGLEEQIHRLTQVKNPTGSQVQRLAMLTKSLERLNRAMPKPKAPPIVTNAMNADLLAKVLDPEYKLYEYQIEFLTSEERFRCILKARQIGFSYVVGLAVLLGAAAGRNQLVVSASEDQADNVIGYMLHHADRLGVDVEKVKEGHRVNGALVKALSTNFRTAQGWPGDVWLDEFAWVRNQKLLWGAIVPSITSMQGRVTVFSTPFMPGSLFWKMATNHQGRYSFFRRWTITIHDAIEQGMPLPGGIEELRMLFDADTWAMFYECQWAEDGTALLSWDLLHSLAVPTVPSVNFGRMRGGVDVGRINDRYAEALIGQEIQGDGFSDRYGLCHWRTEKGASFAQQKANILETDGRFDVESWRIDKTGMGMQLAEEMGEIDPRFLGVWFTAQRKSKLALNLLKLAEDKRLVLPNDPDVLAQLHAVKKLASGGGSTIRYDAERNADGHADLFWAVALAADGRALGGSDGSGASVEIW